MMMDYFDEQVMEEIDVESRAASMLIGAVMQHGEAAYDKVSHIVQAEDFEYPLDAVLWRAMERLIQSGQPCSLPCIMDALRGKDDQPFELNYAIRVSQVYTPQSLWPRYAEMVAQEAKERRARDVMRQGCLDIQSQEKTLEQRIAGVVGALEGVVAERTKTDAVPMSTYASGLIDYVTAIADGVTKPGLAVDIPTLDRMMTGGFKPGQLVIVAARPSVGKSSLAQQFALTLAQRGEAAAFFSMEMTGQELTMRSVANLGRAPLGGLLSGKMDQEEWSCFTDGVEYVMHLPFYVWDKGRMTLAEVTSKARHLSRKHNIKLLVVDYLQLMEGSDQSKDRRIQLEEITRSLKGLAKQLGITIVLLSQLNRQVESRTNPRPQMSDLKECGAIEEDADIIMFIWEHAPNIRGLLVGKNRGGTKGEVALHFEGQYQRWSESTESLHTPKAEPAAKKTSRGMD